MSIHLALIGYGNIAHVLTDLMAQASAPRPDRITVLARPGRSAAARIAIGREIEAEIVESIDDLLALRPDFAVECAGHGAVSDAVVPLLQAGVDCVVVSVGAMADPDLERSLHQAARAGGARIILPAGAIGGVDLLSALALGDGVSVTYRGLKTSRAPARTSAGTAAERRIDLHASGAPKPFFSGTAREAARTYPKNANVAATLALAGAGFEETHVSLVADPSAPNDVQAYEIRSPATRIEIRIENMPPPDAFRTGVSAIYSVLREIRNRIGPVAPIGPI